MGVGGWGLGVGTWRIMWEEGDGLECLFWEIACRECRSFGCLGLDFIYRLDAGGDGWMDGITHRGSPPCGNRVSFPPR